MNVRFYLSGLIAGLYLWSAGGTAAKLADDTVVAKAGLESITRKALSTHLRRCYGKAGLEQLVDRSVLRQEAARKMVTVTDGEVGARAAEVRQAGGTHFQAALEAEGISEEAWRERLRYLVMAEKVRDAKWPVKEADLVRLSVRYARTDTERQAREIIREAQQKISFDLLVLQRSRDKEHGGLVQPNPFLRVDNPPFFKMASDADLRVGQVTPRPLEVSGSWVVLKLENRLGPETLTPKEREEAIRRVKAYRMASLMEFARKGYQTEYPASPLNGDLPDDTVVGRIGAEAITRKALLAYLFDYYGRRGLEQLIERSILSQEASRLGVTVSEVELAARAAGLQKALGAKAFQTVLAKEGITEGTWRERLRYEYLAEKVVNSKYPPKPEDLERLSARYIRLASRAEAEEVIRAAGSVPFERLQRQRSLDRGGDGFVKPNPFLKVDNSTFYQAIREGGTAPGEVLRRPVELGRSYWVLKLEARLGPETLRGRERENVLRRVNAFRMGQLLDENRKAYKVEYLVPIKTLVADVQA